MIKKEDIVEVGKFQKTHALKGELNAILNIDPEFFEEGNAMILEQDGLLVPFFCSSVRTKGSTSYLIKLDGVDSENEASLFVNKGIYVMKDQAAEWLEDEEDEIVSDFHGYEVYDDAGTRIGIVEDIEDSTANVLFVIDSGDDIPVYVPVVEEFILGIDKAHKKLTLSLPEGLLDLNKKDKS